jgi:hypothetical protein
MLSIKNLKMKKVKDFFPSKVSVAAYQKPQVVSQKLKELY